MVVTRRGNAPAPATPRTNSAQPIPKSNKGKTINAANAVDSAPITDDVNGNKESAKPPKNKAKNKKQKKKAPKQTYLTLLTQIFLFIVTVYTLSVCPDDHKLDAPICRGLYLYRKLILEPYIIPPIQYAYHHPAIQANIVQPIQPLVEKAKPAYTSTTHVLGPVYRRSVKGWKQHVIPLWNNRVVPLVQRHALPYWNKHIAPVTGPYVDMALKHWQTVARYYQSYVEPYVRMIVRTLYRIYLRLHPYAVLGLQKSYDGYQRAKPYAAPAWDQVKAGSRSLSAELGSKRREFVDPHLERIWDKVKELSNRNPESDVTSSITVAPEPQVVLSMSDFSLSTSESATEAAAVEPTTSTESDASESPVPTEQAVPSVESVIQQTLLPETEINAEQPVQTDDARQKSVVATETRDPETLHNISPTAFVEGKKADKPEAETMSSASSIIAASAHGEPNVSSLVEEVQSSATQTGSAIPDGTGSSSSPEHVGDSPISSDDLADFLADLGLGDGPKESIISEKASTEPPQIKEETEEQRAERLAQAERHAKLVAEKRANIEGRHTVWEQKLDDLILSQADDLRKLLRDMRANAAKDLEESPEFKSREDKLVQEAEKLLKGVEVYFKTLSGEKRSNEEKRAMWSRVVGKVEEKWKELLIAYQGYVHDWYVNTVNAETAKVYESMGAVKDMADKAQADLGLDYAWLDDVTYEDWSRYHKLMDRSDKYQFVAQSIQNGTDANAPEDIVVHALDDLNEDLRDVITGFETRMRRVKRNGERVFSGKDSVEPEVSGQPVSTPEEEVVIGKSKEQVEQALGGLEPPRENEKQKVEHVEL